MTRFNGRQLTWPAAATIISALVAAAAASWALGTTPMENGRGTASDRELGTINARLTALEQSTDRLRHELRSDLRDLRLLVERSLREEHE